jgi:hypothetical protein
MLVVLSPDERKAVAQAIRAPQAGKGVKPEKVSDNMNQTGGGFEM